MVSKNSLRVYYELRSLTYEQGITDRVSPRFYKPISREEPAESITSERAMNCILEERQLLLLKIGRMSHTIESEERTLKDLKKQKKYLSRRLKDND